jgi:alpha-glucosidase
MKKVVGRLLQVLLLAALVAATAQAEWHSIGNVTGSQVEGSRIAFHTEHAIVQVSVLAPDVVRVRMAHGTSLGPDDSWAVVKKQWPAVHVESSRTTNEEVIRTGKLAIHVRLSPFRLSFEDVSGRTISRATDDLGMVWNGNEVRCWKQMPEDEHYFGLGENAGPRRY